MPTGKSPAPWTRLAETAVARLRANRARIDGLSEVPQQPLPRSPKTLATLASAAAKTDPPMHLPDAELAAIWADGDDPRRIDGEGRDRPETPLPVSELLLITRLAATFGSVTARDAMLTEDAVTVIECAGPEEMALLCRIAWTLLPEDWRSTTQHGAEENTILLQVIPGKETHLRERGLADLPRALSERGPVLCVTDDVSVLPEPLRRGSDILRLAPLDADILVAVLRASHSATGTLDAAALYEALPSDEELARLDETALLLALRAQRPAEVARRLASAQRGGPGTEPTLADVTGYGDAEHQARRMIGDLRAWQAGQVDWAEVERSVIFHGAPGTGKSYLARAMAGEAGLSLARGSFASWQSEGHLGHMLRAMRATFAEARAAAPCVLVIDEIDAVGSRSDGDGHAPNYRRQVVNGFLEQLDALAQMPGVLVVGTCNDIGALDPAVLRPGRFDVHVRVPIPGRVAVARMLRAAFPEASEEVLAPAIRAATGLTAAAIDAAIRAARATAREAKTPVTAQHLLDRLADRVWPPDIAWRIALHEAGHAIVAQALGVGKVRRIALTSEGGIIHIARSRTHGLLADHEALLAYNLAGRAAERRILGCPSSGAGGPADSDLALATALARDIEQRYGLGRGGLAWDRPVEGLDQAIRDRLLVAEAKAVEILEDREAEHVALAEALLAAGTLEADEVAEIVRKKE